MKATVLDEPQLEFGHGGRHVDPRGGIADYGPADLGTTRPERVTIGVVGDADGIEQLRQWLSSCAEGVAAGAKNAARYPRLFPAFPGADGEATFRAEFVVPPELCRAVPRRQLAEACAHPGDAGVHEVVGLYLKEIADLTENARVDVVICIRPDDLASTRDSEPPADGDDSTESAGRDDPADFHDTLKARAMRYAVPIQVMRSGTWTGKSDGEGRRQDEATRAWNLFTALYYKAHGTPWRLWRRSTDLSTLYVGISFFRTLDRSALHTAAAHVFNERGDGMIVRGSKAAIRKHGRQPYLERDDAEALLAAAIDAYRTQHRTSPARVVVHKSSRFEPEEREGFESALTALRVEVAEMVWVSGASDVRLLRTGQLPPLRGTVVELSKDEVLLYTRGTVPGYGTYPGMYIPKPLSLRPVVRDSALIELAAEVLALSKMNWNQTQLDGRWPITLRAARAVGHILRHLAPDAATANRYAYYM